MLLIVNVAMDIETDLVLQRHQHLQFLPMSETILYAFLHLQFLEAVDQKKKLASMFSYSLPTLFYE